MENDVTGNQIQSTSLTASINTNSPRETQTGKQTSSNIKEKYTEHVINQDEILDVRPGSSRQCASGCINKKAAISAITEKSFEHSKQVEEECSGDSYSVHSFESFVCRICHTNENPERLVAPCLCKGTLTYVHMHCLERWISTSRCTTCELCQFEYNTNQTLRYSMFESLRVWYSRSLSRHALQEDCQMFSLLTLVAFGIIGTLLVAVQYYIIQGRITGAGRLWTKGWLIFFLTTTLVVYFVNVYMIAKSQFTPWYRWWQSARDINLILENRRPFRLYNNNNKKRHHQQQQQHNINNSIEANVDQVNRTITHQQHQQHQQNHSTTKLEENLERNLEQIMDKRQEATTIDLPLNINQTMPSPLIPPIPLQLPSTAKVDYVDDKTNNAAMVVAADAITTKEMPSLIKASTIISPIRGHKDNHEHCIICL